MLVRQKIKERVIGIFPLHFGDFQNVFPFKELVSRASQRGCLNILKACQQRDILEVRPGLHPQLHSFPAGRLPKSGGQRLHAPGLKLRREHVNQLGGASRIGIHVAGHIHALLPGAAQQPDHLGYAAVPVAPANGFQVADLHGRFQRAGDGQHFFQGLNDPVALLPHMDGDDPPGTAQRLQRFDQSRRIVKAFRGIPQSQTDAQRPVGEGLLQKPVDEAVFVLRQGTSPEPGGAAPHRPHANQQTIVNPLPGMGKLPRIFRHG